MPDETTKPTIHAPVPEFNQQWQGVFQLAPVDAGDHMYVGNEVRDLDPEPDIDTEMEHCAGYAPFAQELLDAIQEDEA